MSRRLLLFVTSPALLLGIVLVTACTVGVVALNSSQNRLFESVSTKAASLRAAHQMEIALHALRFHTLVYHMNPTAERQRSIEKDHEAFEKALDRARELCPPEQEPLLQEIRDGYQRYRMELQRSVPAAADMKRGEWVEWADAHPIQQVVAPVKSLMETNQKMVHEAFVKTQESNWTAQQFLLVLAIVGPVGGIVSGFALARRLSRSIARLKVRVQDVHSQLAPQQSFVDLHMDRNMGSLDGQLEVVVDRVQVLVEKLQQHQREQARSQKLAVAGQLASSIAHEIRNPLTAMKWLVDNAIQSFASEPTRLEDLQVMQGEIERMKQTVQGMLDFVRPPASEKQGGDLRPVVHQALELIRARKRQLGIRGDLNLPSQPVMVRFDHGQLKSVLVNLLLNALDAMPRGGVLGVHLAANDLGEVRLAIEDSGPGIPETMLEAVFSPFVSTKDTGTGLGLTVSRRLVEEHGGRLTAENRLEGGARFVAVLPLLEPHPANEELACHARVC